MSVKQIMETMEMLFHAKGWSQHTGRGPHGELCLISALSEAAPNNAKHRLEAFYALRDAVRVEDPKFSLANWNDVTGRTLKDVLQLLRRIAHAST